MLLQEQLRKSIRRFAKHQSKHPNVIPHPNGLSTLPRGFRTPSSAAAAKFSTSLSNCHLSNMSIIREDEPSTSSGAAPMTLHKSEPNSPNFIRKCTSQDEERLTKLKDQRYTWPLTLHDLRKPLNVLINGERDGIDYLRVIIDMYLPEYRRADLAGTLPSALKGKEKEIFGNIEEVYRFHQYFVKELEECKNEPTEIGYAFGNNIHRLREIYCEYTINKEQNGSIHHQEDTVKFFSQILHAYSAKNHNKDTVDLGYYKARNFNVNFDSVLMWPVQRLFKYSLLLAELAHFAPCEIPEIKEVKEEIDGITSYANGIVKLADIEGFTLTSDDIFCMADEFVITQQKRVFKREKECQVFLFEDSIVLAKKEKNEKNAIKYLFRDKIMLNDVFVVEHVDSSKIKFGLRKRNTAGSITQSENTIIFKTINNSERIRRQWVKKLRELTVTIQHSPDILSTSFNLNESFRQSFRSTLFSSRPSSTNRNSRSSCESREVSPSTSQHHLTVPNILLQPSFPKDFCHVGIRLSLSP